MSAIISVNDLTVRFDTKTVLKSVSFDVQAGEVFVILGGSGCGKTTLMNHLIGLHEPTSGEIFLEGESIVSAEGVAREKILSNIGVMFQSGALFGSLNLLQNVCVPLAELSHLNKAAQQAVALNKLKLVGLGDYASFMPAEISGGMQKRAAIARAMALDPKILFLDEPSAGLDPITSARLDELIRWLATNLGITFVIVTHELASIYSVADRVIMLHDGQILAQGAPADLRDNSNDDYVKQFFNRVAE
jgi:phospholipid/cholesterol/gamma-HCH transport system ATP-binding protein